MALKFKVLQDALYAKMTPAELYAHQLRVAKSIERARLERDAEFPERL